MAPRVAQQNIDAALAPLGTAQPLNLSSPDNRPIPLDSSETERGAPAYRRRNPLDPSEDEIDAHACRRRKKKKNRKRAHNNMPKFYLYAGLIAGFVIIYLVMISLPKKVDLYDATFSEEESRIAGLYRNYEEISISAADLDPTLDSVEYGEAESLKLYRCGPEPSYYETGFTELILLHGAMYDKEEWMESGILNMLCNLNEASAKSISVTALDLPVSHNGEPLSMAFDALTSRGLLSGHPATFITPSSSGIAVLNLINADDGGNLDELKRIVKAWIPIATKYVNNVPPETLHKFRDEGIPILAINGHLDDKIGREVGKRLRAMAGAKRVQLKGSHKVFADSPREFVKEVVEFLDEYNL